MRRSSIPIEQRRYGALYLFLSILFFIATTWAVVDEFSGRRPWKDYQRTFRDYAVRYWQAKLADESAAFDTSGYREIRAERDSLYAQQQAPALRALADSINAIDDSLNDLNSRLSAAKSRSDEAWYLWKLSLHKGSPDTGQRIAADSLGRMVDDINRRIAGFEEAKRVESKPLAELTARMRTLAGREIRLRAGITAAENALLLYRSSGLSIRQVILPAFDQTSFKTPKPRIDRCQTCHLGWGEAFTDSLPHPYAAHPVKELLAIHNPEVYGCTPCHRGEGPALTVRSAHGTSGSTSEPAFLTGEDVYASCYSCHGNESYLTGGKRFNQSRQLIEESGCVGCHDIKGFASSKSIGPELTGLWTKTTPDWIAGWMSNPRKYLPHTRMPDFRFTARQSAAVTAYLWRNPGTDLRLEPWKGGDPVRGRQLFVSVGCQGCHIARDKDAVRKERGTSYDIAPELTQAGEKLKPDWVYNWIRHPKEIRPSTTMPDLRLNQSEAADITAWLEQSRNAPGVAAPCTSEPDPALEAEGKGLIREYGCTGCHRIPGFSREPKVSVSLSNFGRKSVDELDFGDTNIPRTWDSWVAGKLGNPRVFSTERISSKMPAYAFSEVEISAIRTALRGFTSDAPAEDYRRRFNDRLADLERGRGLAQTYHCTNCHRIEGESGGYIRALFDDDALAPPPLFPEGGKVQERWLQSFLSSPAAIRPWLTLRMPTFNFTDSEITVAAKYFLAMQGKELMLRNYQAVRIEPERIHTGGGLFDMLKCRSCHPAGKVPVGASPTTLAPDLALASTRLKPEWITEWILNPDSIQPGTRMPTFFPDPATASPYSPAYNGSAALQAAAIRDYIWSLGKK